MHYWAVRWAGEKVRPRVVHSIFWKAARTADEWESGTAGLLAVWRVVLKASFWAAKWEHTQAVWSAGCWGYDWVAQTADDLVERWVDWLAATTADLRDGSSVECLVD